MILLLHGCHPNYFSHSQSQNKPTIETSERELQWHWKTDVQKLNGVTIALHIISPTICCRRVGAARSWWLGVQFLPIGATAGPDLFHTPMCRVSDNHGQHWMALLQPQHMDCCERVGVHIWLGLQFLPIAGWWLGAIAVTADLVLLQ